MPPLRPFGVSGAPTNTHLRKPGGSFTLPSGRKTAVEVWLWAAIDVVVRGQRPAPSNPSPAIAMSGYLRISNLLECSNMGRCSSWSLRAENGIATDVNPAGFLRGNVTAKAVFLEIRGDLSAGRIGFEERPAPPVAPERIVGKAALVVLDHHEPDFRASRPVGIACRQSRVAGGEDFLDQHRSIGEPSVLPIELRGPWRRIRVVHLVALGIEDGIRAKHWVEIAIVLRFANVSFGVHEIQ